MRVLNDLRCDHCGLTQELLVENGVRTVDCQDCSNVATRVQHATRTALNPHDPGFPGAYDKWARDRQAKMRQEKKHSSFDPDHGTLTNY